MNPLKSILRALFRLLKSVVLLPQNIRVALQRRQDQVAVNEREAERLDRIRNPSKYLGKP
nr:hypothetical protein [uncultured bacterium]